MKSCSLRRGLATSCCAQRSPCRSPPILDRAPNTVTLDSPFLVSPSNGSRTNRLIVAPLGMGNTAFNLPKEVRAQIPPTADDRSFRHRIIQGEVQDENACVLGGIAGQAGVFSNAVDLARFAHAMLYPENSVFRPETIALFTRRESAPPGTSRALGWDTPSGA